MSITLPKFLFAFVALLLVGAFSPVMAGMNVVTIEARAGNPSWQVELASDSASRSRGLMYRQSMAPQTGMLFRMEDSRVVTMWMKNTYIPLDMIFATQDGRITHIHRGAVPHSLAHISSNGPVRFVLEVNAGEADKYGISVGDRLKHPWILPTN